MSLVRYVIAGAVALVAISSLAKAQDQASIFALRSVWQDQGGKLEGLDGLKGKTTVMTLFYAGCQTVCPLAVAEMQGLERQLPAATREKVRFVLVSLDPLHDKPKLLMQFADARHLDARRWKLLNGAPDDVRDLAAVLDIHYRLLKSGEIPHDAAVFLIDGSGIVRERIADLRANRDASVVTLNNLVSTGP